MSVQSEFDYEQLEQQILHDAGQLSVVPNSMPKLSETNVSFYTQARLDSNVLISSVLNTRETTSQSYWVNINYGPGWGIVPGRVKQLVHIKGLRVNLGHGVQLEDAEFAVVEVFKYRSVLPFKTDKDLDYEQEQASDKPSLTEIDARVDWLL